HKKAIIAFDFRTWPLFRIDAETFVAQHESIMYPLVPVMDGVHRDLMEQVLRELAEIHRDDKQTLSEILAWMVLLLGRNKEIPDLERTRIEEVFNMFREVWDESPWVQKERKEYYAKGKGEGRAEGMAEGELQTLQHTLVRFVQARFPELTELAQEKTKLCTK